MSSREIVLGVLALALLVGLAVFLMPQDSHHPNPDEFQMLTPVSSGDIPKLIKSRGGKFAIVNFWASFCMPCRDEFPNFMQVHRQYRDRGVDLIFVSLDFKSDEPAAVKFLAEQGADFETFIKAEKDDAFIRGVNPDWSGAIPATAFYDANGNQLEFLSKPLSFEELEQRIEKALGETK